MKHDTTILLARLALCLLAGIGTTSAANPAPSAIADPVAPARRPPPEGTVVTRDLAYVEGGHERQKLDLYVPPGVPPFPVIISIHGGGFRQGSKESTRALAELLEAGFAVASINYRYSTQAIFPAQIEDCKAAVRWLRAHAGRYGLDPARIGAWGGSAGGHLAALLGATGHTREFDVGQNLHVSSAIQAVCDWYGPTDFLQMDAQAPAGPNVMRHNPATSPESVLIGGPIQEHPDRVRRANPITYVTRDAPPFLIYHGIDDTSVPVGQSRLLADALREAGAPVTFHEIPDDGHGLKRTGPTLIGPSIEFFIMHLRDNHLNPPTP